MLFVGIDWAEKRHRVVIVGSDGSVLYRGWIEHRGPELMSFENVITHWMPRRQVHVAIELHDSLLLDRLLHCGINVYGLNPKCAERMRERYTATGIKDDDRDAWSLAEYLRCSYHKLRPLRADSELTLALREWVCLREDLVQERTRQLQRLRSHMVRWHPHMLAAVDDLNRKWSLDLMEKYPTADAFANLTREQVDAWSRGRRIRSTTRARIAAAAASSSPTSVASRNAAHASEVKYRVSMICRLNRQLEEVEQALAELADQHPDTFIFRSLPNCGTNTAAAMLAGFGEDRERWSGHGEVAARWGAVPITIQSGKHRKVRRRRACDSTMHQMWIWYAFNSVRKQGCWAGEDYRNKRKTGTEHFTALRGLADRWIKIAYRCWLDRKPYSETTHRQNRTARARPKVQS